MTEDGKRLLLRHAVAVLAYRAAKPLRGVPDGFAERRVQADTRSAGEILSHMGGLAEWALAMAKNGEPLFGTPSPGPMPWDQSVDRFFAGLAALDAFLASDAPLKSPPERLLAGPIADALTHTGQLATLRRCAGASVRGENYFVADIETGRVGRDQAPSRREFD